MKVFKLGALKYIPGSNLLVKYIHVFDFFKKLSGQQYQQLPWVTYLVPKRQVFELAAITTIFKATFPSTSYIQNVIH